MDSIDSFETQEDFLCYLMIYAAYVDFDFSSEEKTLIAQQFGQSTFDKWHRVFLSKGDFQQLKLIMDHKEHYIKNSAHKQKLISMLNQVFGSDGDYSKLEKNQMLFFDRLFSL